jgi:two-component system chemotaxis sensor kinase CheA
MQAVQQQVEGNPPHVGEIVVEKGVVHSQDSRESVTVPQESKDGTVADTTIRVDVGLLDKLMNLVGELVLARNQILQFSATQKDPTFLSTTQRLNLITTELQESVMKTRMQPIGNIWNRFPRLVRDLAITCGKEVRLEMEGKETELDKTIIEAIKDPLTHIVRNAVDHGIEKPDVRRALGKPTAGTLLLRAFHEGGQVNIEITDDGAGVDTERVKAKAIERGLISRDQAVRMSEREIIHLLFLPGFSTAEKVTNVSGRGVGMDVVKTSIEKIGGNVDLQSQPGKGTTIKIKIPLTLSIIPALIVTSGGERFAIPQVNLLELVRLEGEEAKKGIERVHGALVYRLRGNLLPLVFLDHELNSERSTKGTERDTINIVVLQADDRQFGLVVEGINDMEEIVVKPLGKLLKGIPVFAGATIMGDGKLALILDVLGIAQRAGVISEVRDRVLTELAGKSEEKHSVTQPLLLLGVGKDRRAAIPLSKVARLEEIPAADIERAGNQEVVQYRNQILPLIRLGNVLGDGGEVAKDPMQVVVCSEQGRTVGLVVDRIIDIVDTSIEVQRATQRQGVVASAVIQKRVTDLLDVHGIIRSVDPSFFENAAAI